MSIDSIAGGTTAQSLYKTQFQQERQYFTQLAQALNSGDLAGAQKAYASLQQLQSQQQGQSGTQSGPQTQVQKDLAAVGQALQSGDLNGAQAAFAQLKQDVQAARGGGHHHHHASPVAATPAAATTVDSDGDNDGSTGTATIATGLNISA